MATVRFINLSAELPFIYGSIADEKKQTKTDKTRDKSKNNRGDVSYGKSISSLPILNTPFFGLLGRVAHN